MLKEFVDRIIALSDPKTIQVDGLARTNQSFRIVMPPTADAFSVSSLSAMCQYVNENIDAIDDMKGSAQKLVCHIESPTAVWLFSYLDARYRTREYYIKAQKIEVDLPIEKWLPTDQFIMGLLSSFEKNDDLEKLLKVVSGLKLDGTITHTDDGTSQEVQSKSGIARIENVILPNPLRLIPHCTFPEVIQPERGFVIRMNATGNAIECRLIEADNGAWRLDAMIKIAEYIKENTKGVGMHVLY